MTPETEFDPTARLLTDALNTDPPPEAESRMRERLNSLRTRMEATTAAPTGRQFKTRRWFAGATALASVCAAGLLLAIVLLPSGSSRALAQIVEAVAAKTWLHLSGTAPDGQPVEIWFSGTKGVLGRRTGESFVFVDQTQGTMDVFGKPANADAVQRVRLEHVNATGIDAARQSFLALLGGDLQSAMKSRDEQVLEHESKTIRVEGREWIEHRFVVGRKGHDEPRSESLLRVDPQTHLPISWQMKRGDRPLSEFKVSYPDRGPLTIFAMGVPATTRIDDSTPQGEFKDLLVATRAARRRFDDYQGVWILSRTSDRAGSADSARRFWRKGDRWRIDELQLKIGATAPPDADPEVWWLNEARSGRSFPSEIWDGKRIWTFEPVVAKPSQDDPAAPGWLLIDSLKSRSRAVADPKDLPKPVLLPDLLAELYAYEHFSRAASPGFRAETRAVTLGKLPMTLVEIFGPSSSQQYWHDPKRGHMIVRKEFFEASRKSISVSEVLTAVQTPQGLWYPTTVRQIGNGPPLNDGSRSDTYVRYYLEFNAAIPDELFNAEAVDAKNFWTQSK